MSTVEICCLTGAALAFACVVLIDALRRRAIRAERSLLDRIDTGEQRFEDLMVQFKSLEARMEEVRLESGLLVPPEPPRSGLNLNRRSEALWRLRKGETADEISTALGVPVAEVQLLEKVQKILVGS
ncbi:MAG TPA: hypothetical protein VN428_15195 [Bryobacteraceae bacterium]|nr:hypothetical protein [Bryobacteraceae bacterium]